MLGFYDYDGKGQTRAVRNDLAGGLKAMVQFGQNLTLNPAGNAALNMPSIVTDREALLLLTPDPAVADSINALTVTATVDGVAQAPLKLVGPNDLDAADRPSKDARPDVTYSKRAWSVVLPWAWMHKGLSLMFTDDQGRTGTLGANGIEWGVPGQLTVASIRLGMLTPPPKDPNQHMLLNPADGAADYFQTTPAATFTVASYDDEYLDTVMVGNGTIYKAPGTSATTGDVYSGDMRSDTAKATFSTGINLANWGVTSAGMSSQEQPQLTQEAIVHHAAGAYTNGVVVHGLSGGNGILTLIASWGNEFSHEIGHHYGLGHYPGAQLDPKNFWDFHQADDGWGYIAYRHRMRASLNWGRAFNPNATDPTNFQGLYNYDPDAMAGGDFTSSLSNYTLYTGYSTFTKIQPAMDHVQYSNDSPTGFLKWNAADGKMESIPAPATPKSSTVWYNAATFRRPRLLGVPVFTLLGGYDPEAKTAVIYPAARGNWGNVFSLPAPVANATTRQCWLDVGFANGTHQQIAVAPQRMGSNADKFGVNIAQSDQPASAALYCQTPGAQPTQLGNAIAIAQNLPPMAPAVTVGKQFGYDALAAEELPELDADLQKLAGQAVPILSGRAQLLYNSWGADAGELSAAAKTQFDRYADLLSRMQRLNRWMYAYRVQLQGTDPAADKALLAFIDQLSLRGTGMLLPAATRVNVGASNCLKLDMTGTQGNVYISAASACSGAPNETWVADAAGRIRNGADLSQCLTKNGDTVVASTCDVTQMSQVWDLSALPAIKQASACMDMQNGYLTNGRASVITYSCSGGANQKWTGLVVASGNELLPLINPVNLPVLVRLNAGN